MLSVCEGVVELFCEIVVCFCFDEFLCGCLVVFVVLIGILESEVVWDVLSVECGELICLFCECMWCGIVDGDLVVDIDVEELVIFYVIVLFGFSV